MLSHILHENTIMNMIEGMRKAYKIIIERNTSHALFEDDIVLATSSRAVQQYLAERAETHSVIDLGGCLVGCVWRDMAVCYHGSRITCAHARYLHPAVAYQLLRATDNCSSLMHGLDGFFATHFCGEEGSKKGLRPCADWQPLLRYYQGAGWLPLDLDERCNECQGRKHVHVRQKISQHSTSSWFNEDEWPARCRNCEALPLSNRSKHFWYPDPRGWVGFGHFLQDRRKVEPHLHNSDNKLRSNMATNFLVRDGEASVAAASANTSSATRRI